MKKWRENTRPERSEAGADPGGGEGSASGGPVFDPGTRLFPDVPGGTAGTNDHTRAEGTPDAPHAADLEDRSAPDDAKAIANTMSAPSSPGDTSRTPTSGGTRRTPTQRGPRRESGEDGPAGATPGAFEDSEETRTLGLRSRAAPRPSSAGPTGFAASLSAQGPTSPVPPRTTSHDLGKGGAEATAPVPAAPTGRMPAEETVEAADADVAGHAHDPHEVTVQLDAVQFGDGVLRATPARPGGDTGRDIADGPVFVDESGRRSRLYRRIGLVVGLVCAGYAAVIVVTLMSGNSSAPWLPVPGQEQEQEQPTGKVETSPRPAEPDTSPSAEPTVDVAPPAGGFETPVSPDGSFPAGGLMSPEADSGGTVVPSPSPTGEVPEPDTGSGGSVTPEPTDPPTETEPVDPPTSSAGTGTGTAPDTSPTEEDPGEEEPGGTDTAARLPETPPTADADSFDAQPDPSPVPTAPSPEHVL